MVECPRQGRKKERVNRRNFPKIFAPMEEKKIRRRKENAEQRAAVPRREGRDEKGFVREGRIATKQQGGGRREN